MGLLDYLKALLRQSDVPPPDVGMGAGELVRRLGVRFDELQSVPITYETFNIPKRRGGTRTISAPNAALKAAQRRILRLLLAELEAHPAATGFEKRQSIVTHARLHAFKPIVIKLDIKDFFGSTSAKRVHAYFRHIGWNEEAAKLLTRLTTHNNALPQGAPTSPRLANLVNYRMDARIDALMAGDRDTIRVNPETGQRIATPARRYGYYSRYADDITLSFPHEGHHANEFIQGVKMIVVDEGYVLHTKKKLRVMRGHDRQQVTGLVVNKGVRLPRDTRRWLRAVEHHIRYGRPATLSVAQIQGWRALQAMIEKQATVRRQR